MEAQTERIALVEDDVLFADYLVSVLRTSGRYEVTARADSAEQALAWVLPTPPAALLLDVKLPGMSGSMAVGALLAKWPALKVVILTGQDGDEPLLAAIRAGAAGYLLKSGGSQALLTALDDVLSGGAPMSPGIAKRVMAMLREPGPDAGSGRREVAAELRELTEREREVLALVAQGDADKEICAKLGLTRSTVKNHLTAIYDKWRVRSRTQAAVKFVKVTKG